VGPSENVWDPPRFGQGGGIVDTGAPKDRDRPFKLKGSLLPTPLNSRLEALTLTSKKKVP
jgi:hypothetical protein